MMKQLGFALVGVLAVMIFASCPARAQPATASMYPEPVSQDIFRVGYRVDLFRGAGVGRQLVSADFNGDGWPDYIATLTPLVGDYYYLAVYLSKGEGKYNHPQIRALDFDYPMGSLLIAIGDINNDGFPDLAIGGASPQGGVQISIYLDDGSGTFTLSSVYLPAKNPRTQLISMVVGDATGDGNNDVLLGSGRGTIYVLPGEGNGILDMAGIQVLTLPNATIGLGVIIGAPADINQDGLPDIVCYYPFHSYVFEGEGDDKISPMPSQSIYTTKAYPIPLIADFNSDGVPDVVMVGDSGIEVLLNVGGILSLTKTYPLSHAIRAWAHVTDIDGDGNMDILMPEEETDRTGILYGRGDGTFGQLTFVQLGYNVKDVVAADMDQDGRRDLVSLYSGSYTTVMTAYNLGNRKFLDYKDYPYSRQEGSSGGVNSKGSSGLWVYSAGMASADFDSNGKPDIVIANTASVSVLLNDGAGGVLAPVILTAGQGFNTNGLAIGDVNSDGIMDIVSAKRGKLIVFPGNGDGTFSSAIESLEPEGSSITAKGLPLGDVDNDGLLDVAMSVVDSSHKVVVRICRGDGTGHFDCGAYAPISVDAYSRIVLDDVSGDGNLDLIESTDNCSCVLLGDGDGGFAPSEKLQAPDQLMPPQNSGVAVGDVNGDGKSDLLFATTYENICVFMGNGDGTFREGACYGTAYMTTFGGGEVNLALGDVNGDSRPDIVATTLDNVVSVLINLGGGHFSSPLNYATSLYASPILVMDMNGDGLLDFATADSEAFISVYLHNSLPTGYRPPVANNGMVKTTEDVEVTGQLGVAANDAGYVVFSIVSPPSSGTLDSFNDLTGEFKYSPDKGYSGTATFDFRVVGFAGNVSNVATETISVKANGSGNNLPPRGNEGGGGGKFGWFSLLMLFGLVLAGTKVKLRRPG